LAFLAVGFGYIAVTGAGDGNRTHVRSLGSSSSTIELHPQSASGIGVYRIVGVSVTSQTLEVMMAVGDENETLPSLIGMQEKRPPVSVAVFTKSR
jgi:hypothetical protein